MVEFITVGTFFEENKNRLKLESVASDNGFSRRISKSDMHRPGLALAGFVALFSYDRVQVLGNTEIRYLNTLSEKRLIKSIERVIEFEIPCIVVTNNNKVPEFLIKAATKRYISIFKTPLGTTTFVHLMGDYLDKKFAPQVSMHASLVDVYGIGMLITGRSGIGKSEVALDLVERGHRLVADDVILITRTSEDMLIGRGTELSEHHIELRGVGVIDVKKIFGVRGVRVQKRIEVEVRLMDWDAKEVYDRTGLLEEKADILGVEIPVIKLPINPGKNMTVICETIAMNELLKHQGYHTAKEFNQRLKKFMKKKKLSGKFDIVPTLERDNE